MFMRDNPNQPQQYPDDLLTPQQTHTASSYPPNNTRKQPRNLNYRFLLLLALVVVLLLASVAGVFSFALYNSINATPSKPSHPTVLPQHTSVKKSSTLTPVNANPTIVVREYCDALRNKNYNTAYSFFDPQGTVGEGV